jgi:uncharacterized protein (DUF697 family)
MALPVGPFSIYRLLRELRGISADPRPLGVGGSRELAGALARELTRGGDPTAVREVGTDPGGVRGVAALVYVLAGKPQEEDGRVLKAASMAGMPIVCLVAGGERLEVPYALAEDVFPLGAGEGFPIEEIGQALGKRLDEQAAPLAARLPVLRRGVATAWIAKVSKQNAVLSAAIFVPGADMAVLTLNQVRLVVRLAAAWGREVDQKLMPEILAVVASGFGFRAIARSLIGVVPILGWAVQGGVALVGTRALGEATVRYLEETSGRGRAEPSAAGSDRA